MIEVSIITLNYNRENHLDTWITEFYKHIPNFSYEILLLDNASNPENFRKLHEKWSHKKEIRWIEFGSNLGFGKPHNEASKYARGEFLVFSNPDTLIPKNGIEPLIEFLKKHKDVGIVGAKLIGESGTIHDSYRRFMKPYDWLIKRLKPLHKIKFIQNHVRNFLMWDMDNTKIQTVDWIQGSSMVMRKSDFDAIGGFDDRYFIFVEDMDLCRKMWNLGKKIVYYPEVVWFHSDKRGSNSGSVFKDLFKKTAWWHLSSLIKYFLKWGIKNPNIEH